MPVSTQLIRAGSPIRLSWSWQYISALQYAMAEELGKEVDDTPAFPREGKFTFVNEHKYHWTEHRTAEDGTPVHFKVQFTVFPGDEYRAWR